MSGTACTHEHIRAEMIPGTGYFELRCISCRAEVNAGIELKRMMHKEEQEECEHRIIKPVVQTDSDTGEVIKTEIWCAECGKKAEREEKERINERLKKAQQSRLNTPRQGFITIREGTVHLLEEQTTYDGYERL